MITHESSSDLLTVSEAAAELRVSQPTIRRWIAALRLPAVRIGGRAIRIHRTDLRRLEEPTHVRRPMTMEELAPYILPQPDPTMSEEELMAEIQTINERILARRGGVPLPPSLPLIHEARRERDERL